MSAFTKSTQVSPAAGVDLLPSGQLARPAAGYRAHPALALQLPTGCRA